MFNKGHMKYHRSKCIYFITKYKHNILTVCVQNLFTDRSVQSKRFGGHCPCMITELHNIYKPGTQQAAASPTGTSIPTALVTGLGYQRQTTLAYSTPFLRGLYQSPQNIYHIEIFSILIVSV